MAFNLKTELTNANSGAGTTVLTMEQTIDVVRAGEKDKLFLVGVEVYELRDDLEIPRVDLLLYNICNEEAIRSLPLKEKQRACRSAINDLMNIVKTEKKKFGFRVWLED